MSKDKILKVLGIAALGYLGYKIIVKKSFDISELDIFKAINARTSEPNKPDSLVPNNVNAVGSGEVNPT